MRWLFWISLGLVAYVYVGYPLLLAAWARLRTRAPRVDDTEAPPVSVILAARNEAARLPGRIENLLALDYPAERLEIVVVSDGSTDRTAQALAPYLLERPGHARVRLVEQPPEGKAAALNRGVAAASHGILVFADARQRFARDAVRRLVSNFADPAVGAVSGELVLDCEFDAADSSVADGVGAYWRYEKWLRAHESAVDSMLGATGAIYAMRRDAWRALPPGTILDDVLAPMRAVLGGWRVVFDGRARAFDVTAPDAGAEARRKQRTLAGNWQILALEPRLLVPVVNRVWLQYCSHKIGRLLVPWALVGIFVSSLLLIGESLVYLAVFVGQVAFYGLAFYGAWLERREVQVRQAAARPAEDGRAVNA
jgi:poly-beta-1,6-N-acetyl-D-glucosamine synthase